MTRGRIPTPKYRWPRLNRAFVPSSKRDRQVPLPALGAAREAVGLKNRHSSWGSIYKFLRDGSQPISSTCVLTQE
jgi:hypothetical protein